MDKKIFAFATLAIASLAGAACSSTSGTGLDQPTQSSDPAQPIAPAPSGTRSPSSSTGSNTTTPDPTTPSPTTTEKPEVAGEFTLFVIPPESSLDWSSPGKLARTAGYAEAAGRAHKIAGEVETAHSIGHVYVRLSCGDVNIATTGQTGGGGEFKHALDGAGGLFQGFGGSLDLPDESDADIATRTASGRVRFVSFRVRKDTCIHLRGFLDEYVKREAYKVYGSQYRPRRWEGAGCTAFGLAFVETAGLLRRSLYTSDWARQVNVGLARMADVSGDGFYDYGSNLRSPAVVWPKGVNIQVSKWPISLASNLLADWNSSTKDVDANQAPLVQPNQVPLTLYDPELMTAFIDRVHESGGGDIIGRKWAVRDVGRAFGIVTDAIDAVHLPWEDAVDDLNAD